MPELPDIAIYEERLGALCIGNRLKDLRLRSSFLLRSVEPPATDAIGRTLVGVGHIGKRLVLSFDPEIHLVLHLMIAGRLRLAKPGKKPAGGKNLLLELEFSEAGTIALTEQGSKKRASLSAVARRADLASFDRGGLEPLGLDLAVFTERLTRENRTLKRTLTDPTIFSGIGNAYSDEILFAARLSPTQRTGNLDSDEIARLHDSVESVLIQWTEQSRREAGNGFPDKVTAFRAGMNVHGRYREPCTRCDAKIQRIRYAENECNYCPECQTGGKLLADRGLSRLLGKDWPKTWEELEGRRTGSDRTHP